MVRTKVEDLRAFRRLGNQIWLEAHNGKRQMVCLGATEEMTDWMASQLRSANPFLPWLKWQEPYQAPEASRGPE